MVNLGSNKDEVDLMVFGEILVKHILYLKGRPEKKDFIDDVTQRFYISPATKFGDEMVAFKTSLEGNSTIYNDALLFTMAICADLITPEVYFDKLLVQYGKLIDAMPVSDSLKVGLKKENHFECIFFALRFFIDQVDLIAPPPAPPEEKKEETK